MTDEFRVKCNRVLRHSSPHQAHDWTIPPTDSWKGKAIEYQAAFFVRRRGGFGLGRNCRRWCVLLLFPLPQPPGRGDRRVHSIGCTGVPVGQSSSRHRPDKVRQGFSGPAANRGLPRKAGPDSGRSGKGDRLSSHRQCVPMAGHKHLFCPSQYRPGCAGVGLVGAFQGPGSRS